MKNIEYESQTMLSIEGGTNIPFGRGGKAIFVHKAINDQSSKLKNS